MAYGLSPVVASIGRSGSGVLRDSIASTIKKQVPDITNINMAIPGHVCKTHMYPPKIVPKYVRMIFLFSNPIDIIFSLIHIWENEPSGQNFFRAHSSHLSASNASYEELIHKDVLKLEDMFNAFLNIENYPVLLLKYPDMFNHKQEIASFFEKDFDMKKQRPRETGVHTVVDGENKKKYIENTYSSLIAKINDMPSYVVRN